MPSKAKICLFTILVLVGCSPKIQRLDIVRIGNIRLDSVTPEVLTLRAELAVRNPYSSSARLKNISFDLALTDHFIAYGKKMDPTELKSGSVAILDVPLVLQCKQVTEKDLAALLSHEIPYRIEGTGLLEQPFGPRTLPIQIQNRIKAPDRLQVFLPHKSSASILSLEKIETRQFLSLIRKRRLNARFNNPFSFPLTVHDFHYEVRWGKQVVANGEAHNQLQLLPGENRIELGVYPKPAGAVEGLFKGLLDREIPDLTLSAEFRIVHETRDLKVRLVYIPE